MGGGDVAVSKMGEELGAARQHFNLAKEFCLGSRQRRKGRGGGEGEGGEVDGEAEAEAEVVGEA